MKVGEVGSIVWVQKKDGIWWPGRVLSLGEVSASDHSSSFAFTSKIPIMFLGRNNSSVEWHKLEDSWRIKSFRDGDFDDFIKKDESTQDSVCMERIKCAYQEDILHALQLENQEHRNMLERPVNVPQGTTSREKRSRCVHIHVKSFNRDEHSVCHPQPRKFSPSTQAMDDYSHESILAETTPFEATISDFSRGDIQHFKGIIQYTGLKKQNLGENSDIQNRSWTPLVIMDEKTVRFRKRVHNVIDLLMENATYKSRCWYEHRSGERSPLEVGKLSYSYCEGNHSEDSEILSFGSLSTEHPNLMRTKLMDVEITVLANHRREDVPLVSLMSRLNGKSIIGHPIETEALDSSSDVFLFKKGKLELELEDKENRVNQLVWRTCKRTPICYISNLNACPSNGKETDQEICKISGGSSVVARKDSLSTEKALWNPQIPASFSKNEAANLYAMGRKDGLKRQKDSVEQRTTCVSVSCVFSNLLLAVGRE